MPKLPSSTRAARRHFLKQHSCPSDHRNGGRATLALNRRARVVSFDECLSGFPCAISDTSASQQQQEHAGSGVVVTRVARASGDFGLLRSKSRGQSSNLASLSLSSSDEQDSSFVGTEAQETRSERVSMTNCVDDESSSSSVWGQFIDVVPSDEQLGNGTLDRYWMPNTPLMRRKPSVPMPRSFLSSHPYANVTPTNSPTVPIDSPLSSSETQWRSDGRHAVWSRRNLQMRKSRLRSSDDKMRNCFLMSPIAGVSWPSPPTSDGSCGDEDLERQLLQMHM